MVFLVCFEKIYNIIERQAMIKGIIEKIIMNTFGKFVKGIEKEKLSVDLFSGNFKLQNIALNHDFFNSLNSPLSLVFSSIGTLTLQASLSKLSSVPVECVLDNIFVICQFREAQMNGGDSSAARRQKLLREVGEVFESALKKVKEEKKEDGMMARLGKKVIDNLQLRIVNVHVRFEEGTRTSNNNYAWGLTLDQISLTTTDHSWKPSFIERSNEAADKLYKMLQVKKLNLYWESGINGKLQLLKDKQHSDATRKTRLAEMAKEERQVVISITSEFKLIINPPQDLSSPLYQLEVGLQPIKFELQRLQLQQMMDFARKNIMQNELIVKTISKRSKNKLSEEEKCRLKQLFEDFISQAIDVQQAGSSLDTNQYDLEEVFEKIQESQLKLWALGPVKRKIKNIREIQMKKKKSGWFSRGDNELTSQEQEELQRYIDTSLQGEDKGREPSCLLFRVGVQLKGGRMLLVQHKNEQTEEQIEFNIGRIGCQLSKSSDKSFFHSHLDIASISLNLFIPIQKNNVSKRRKLQIFTSQRPDDYKEQSDEDSMESFDSAEEEARGNFLKIDYKNELLQGGAVLKRTIEGSIERITVIYKKIYMQKFRKFFTFKKGASFVKGGSLDPTTTVEEEVPQNLQDSNFRIDKILDVKLIINSPVFICPLNQQQCWCLSLGQLTINSSRNDEMEEFPMKVSSAFLRYYPFMKQCFDLKKKTLKKGVFSLINDMDFNVSYQRLKKVKEELLSIQLPSFKVNFTQKQYENLVSLQKVFSSEDAQKKTMIEILKEERQAVEQLKVFEGPILRKHETLMSWKDFHGIISGQHLFLYSDKKELKEHSKIAIKHAKITIKQSAQNDEDNLEIEITNQSETCYLGCHTMEELLKWKLQLDKKNREFKTIHELIKENQFAEQSSGKKRSPSQSLNWGEEAIKRKILRFRVREVQFRYENEGGESQLQLQVTQVQFTRQNMHEWSEKQFSMRSLSITDHIFKFKNPIYQTLVQARGVKLQEVKGRRRSQQTRKTAITASIQDIHINWKPDVLLILMRLLSRHFQTQKKHRVDDDIQQSREDHFRQVYADSSFMFLRETYNEKGKGIKVKEKRDSLSLRSKWMRETMSTSFTVDKLEINMVHRESHLVMIKMLATQIECGLSVCDTAKFLRGTITGLQLFDMTGYPQKDYSPDQEHPPYRILTKQAQLDRPLIEFRWSAYQANNFPNEQRIDSFIWVEIAPVEYEYYQQVTFRLVDYILIQVILLLTQPQMLTVNEDLLQQLRREEKVEEKPVRIVFSQFEEVIRRLVHPCFMDMSFRLQGLTLILKAEKNSHIYYKTVISQLLFSNATKKNAARFDEQARKVLDGLIYEDEYRVTASDCHFIQVCQKQGKTEQLFQPFEMQLILSKLILEDEINLLYPQIQKYDRSFLTQNRISRIVIAHYSRLQYLNINKLVNFNFTFDDQSDELFIHNFKITKLLSPKPIFYEVLLPAISMTADYNAKENSQDIWRLFRADITDFRMVYRRTKQLDSSITLALGRTFVTGFQYLPGQPEPVEHYLMSLSGRGSEVSSTEIVIQNKTSGQKLIQMNVGDMKVNVRTGLLQLIFEYTLIEDWVFPTINKYVTQLVFYATVQKMTADLCEDPRSIAAQLKRKNAGAKVVEFVLSEKSDFASFKLEGLLCYKFHRKRDDTTQEYEKRLQRKQLNFQDFQKMPAVAFMNVILNTQIYRGWVKNPAKRKIIQKFTFTMQDKRHLRVADINNCTIRTIAKRTMNIDKGFLKISFKDILLMQKILQQISEERKYITYLNEKTGKLQQPQQNQLKQTESSSMENLQVKVDALSFYLINSRRDIFIPILKIIVNGLSLTKANTFKKDILKGELSTTVYYFNNSIFRWQPILQKVALGFHKLTYYQENNSIFASFDSAEPIMINLSRQVFISINQTLAGWKKQSQQEQKKYYYLRTEVEPLEFISHYIIRNETGYPIEILNQRNVVIKKIGHNQQMDYEQQIQDWEENQDQIFIGVRILHPRHQFKAINNISFSSEKQYELLPKLVGGPNSIVNLHSKILIKPEVKDSKKVLMVKSSKYVYNYFDGACEVTALPFDHDQYYVLPKEIHNQLKVSLYEETATEYYRYVGKDGVLKIMKKNLVYNYSPIPLQICGKMVKPNDYMGISQKLRIQDVPYKDSLLKVIKHQKHRQYYIFSECYVIDYYGLNLQFEKQSRNILKMYSHKFLKDEFTYHIYILPETEFKFKAKLPESGINTASLKTTIGRTYFSLQTKKSLCMFSLHSYLHPLQNSHISEFARIIEITPQYMLSNATKLLIKICQAESCDSVALNPYERLPFFWQNKLKPKCIKISAYDGSDFWGYSGNLTIQKSTQTIVLRKSSDPTMYRVFSIQVEITNTVTFIHILQSSPKYLIANSIPGTILQVYQAAIMDEKLDLEYSFPKEFVFNVKHKEEKPFGYELPLQSHRLHIKVQLDQQRTELKGLYCEMITFEDVQGNLDSKVIPLKNEQGSIVGEFYLRLCFQNNLKKLKLTAWVEEEEVENNYEYIVKLPHLGVSFIGFYQGKRRQILHLIFDAIDVTFSGNADYSDIDLRVSRLRIQNQLKYNAIFPVVFESQHTKQAKYFINFKITRSGKNSRLIHYIGCSINKSWLAITSEQLQVIQENISKVTSKGEGEGQVRECEMFKVNLPDPQQSIYFVEAVIHPLKSNITFKHVNQWGGKLLKTFSSINECPISAEGLKFKHFSCQNFKFFFDLLLKHYQDGLSKMILPMIGNLTILGSPVTFVQKIGSGFKDLVELPAEGFQTSPLEGGKGVYRGAKSLLTNTFQGAFNTVQSLTGSLGNGITLLVDDHEEFTKERLSIKNDRSQHVLGGLANGAKSIAYGVKNGFTGFFTEPVKGAQKSGLPGFFLGAAKGIGGLILKPLSGVVDAASKTAQGIKNTPQFLSRDRQNRFIRQHNPRAFYNYYKQYRNYDKFFADIIKIFEEQDKQKYANLSWCGYFTLLSQKKHSTPILFLSYEFLIIYDIAKKRFLQTLRCQNLLSVQINEEKGQSVLRIRIWQKKSNREGFITLCPDGGCRKLANEINTIIRHFSPSFKFV